MIHAFPGMGADRRMFPEPWPSLPDFLAHDWPPYSGEMSIRHVAAALIKARKITDGDVLIGSSLGGIVACEITKMVEIPELYLVGSAVNREEVNGLLAAIHPLVHIAPIDWLRFSAGKIPNDLPQMFAQADAGFLRAMCAAIFKWEGLGVTRTRLYRIHGRRDLVISHPAKADLLLDGGHLISMTHAPQCVDFIAGKIKLRTD